MSARRKSTGRRVFGSVRRERSGRYSAHYTDKTTGRRVAAPITFASEQAADDWLTTVRADDLRGVLRPADRGAELLRDYFARWLDDHPNLASSTRDQYADHLRRWIDRELRPRPTGRTSRAVRPVRLGAVTVASITPATIREWFAAASYTQQAEAAERHALAVFKADRRHPARVWAEATGVPCPTHGRLSPVIVAAWRRAGSPLPRPAMPTLDPDAKPAVVIRQAYRTVHACLADAVRDGLIDANPCQIAGAGSAKAAERHTATVAEVDALAAAMPDRYAAAVILAAWSGLRAGELFGLARRHVDLDAGTVHVERAMKDPRKAGARPYLGRTKTDASRRVVALPGSVVDVLREHMAAFVGRGPDALLFARPDGQLVPSWERRAMFHRARLTVGRPDLRWHDLRHTGATFAAGTGASIRAIQHRLGHSTYAAAMTYQHASAEQDRALADRLDQLAEAQRSGTVTPLRRLDTTEASA